MWRPKQLQRIWEGVNLAWLTCFAASELLKGRPQLESNTSVWLEARNETSREVWSHLISTTCTVDVVQSFGIWHWTRQVRLWTDSLKSRGGGRILFGNRLVTPSTTTTKLCMTVPWKSTRVKWTIAMWTIASRTQAAISETVVLDCPEA